MPEITETVHTVVILELKDPTEKEKVVAALSKVIRNYPPEKVEKKLNSLPWTLTKKASPKNAARLALLLKKVGAIVKIIPPLSPSIISESETQILPETKLLTQTQVASATQFALTHDKPRIGEPLTPSQATLSDSPKPIEPTSFPSAEAPKLGFESERKLKMPLSVGQRSKPPDKEISASVDSSEDGWTIEPLSLAGILDRTFQICRQHFWKLLGITGVWWVATIVLSVVAVLVALLAGFTYNSILNTPLWIIIPLALTVGTAILILLIGLFYLTQGALIYAVSCIYLNREVRIRSAYSFVFTRLRKLIFTSILVFLLILTVLLAVAAVGAVIFYVFQQLTGSTQLAIFWSIPFWMGLVVVPMYVGMKLLLIDKVVIIEDLGYMDAVKRSWDLLRGKAEGHWPKRFFWRFIILLNLFMLINIAVSMIFQIPASLILLLPLPELLGNILNQVLTSIGGVITGVFGSVCLVIFYYDIRNRKEGFDLAMLADSQPT